MVGCFVANEVWRFFFSICSIEVHDSMRSLQELLQTLSSLNFGAAKGSFMMALFATTCYFLWNARNNFIHNDKEISAVSIWSKVMSAMQLSVKAGLLGGRNCDLNCVWFNDWVGKVSLRKKLPRCIVWNPPESDSIKINFDAAFLIGTQRAAAIFRNSKGEFLLAFSRKIVSWSVVHAEMIAVELALCLAVNSAIENIWVEGDALQVINILSHGDKFPAHCLFTFLKIKKLQQQLDIRYTHIYREGNQIAHELARLNLDGTIAFADLPAKVKGKFLLEASRLPHIIDRYM